MEYQDDIYLIVLDVVTKQIVSLDTYLIPNLLLDSKSRLPIPVFSG